MNSKEGVGSVSGLNERSRRARISFVVEKERERTRRRSYSLDVVDNSNLRSSMVFVLPALLHHPLEPLHRPPSTMILSVDEGRRELVRGEAERTSRSRLVSSSGSDIVGGSGRRDEGGRDGVENGDVGIEVVAVRRFLRVREEVGEEVGLRDVVGKGRR